jgi:hypothetical protein
MKRSMLFTPSHRPGWLSLSGLIFLFVFNPCFAAFNGTTLFPDPRKDYDLDDDGLIEINSLADLDEIRNNLTDLDLLNALQDGETFYGVTLYGKSTGCPSKGCTGYELTTDLNFDSNGDGVFDQLDNFWNDGAGWQPIDDASHRTFFVATFEGNHHKIKNLVINNRITSGLFGIVERSTIRNVELSGPLMHIQGGRAAAALLGYAEDSTILNCSVSGVINGVNPVGGLIATALSSKIDNSHSTAVVSGEDQTGGLIGKLSFSTLSHSYAIAQVKGKSSVGGLVGDSQKSIINTAFSASDVEGNYEEVGGLIGEAGVSQVENSYSMGTVRGGSDKNSLVGVHDFYDTTINNSYAFSVLDTGACGNSFYRRSAREGSGCGSNTLIEETWPRTEQTDLRCPTQPNDTHCIPGIHL